MRKKQLIRSIAQASGLTHRKVEEVLTLLSTTVKAEVKATGSSIVHGLVRVKQTHRNARLGRNPRTGVEVMIPARTAIKIVADRPQQW